ncbi:MAG: hypothetical protein ABUK11_07515 [Mariprofundaceae bacterium]
MSGWGCPHEEQGECRRVPGKKCEPGMKGCTLSGRFTFSSSEKNISRRLKQSERSENGNKLEKD